MNSAALAERARRLLLAQGGRAGEAELLGALFGPGLDPRRWGALLHTVLEALPGVHQLPNGEWELLVGDVPAGRPTELTIVALASVVTAANPWRGRLVALAARRTRGGQVDAVFDAVFNPHQRLPRYLAVATGLTQHDLDEAPAFERLVDDFLEVIGQAPLVGVDIETQVAAIEHELSRLDRPGLRNRLIDLASLAERAGVVARKPTLVALASAVGLSHPRPYRPGLDAGVAARAAQQLLSRAEGRGLLARDLFESQEPNPSGVLEGGPPPPAPAGPGVYLLLDGQDRVLYVGKAGQLRRRVASYHRRQLGILRRLEGLSRAVERIETIETGCGLAALLLEARLLRRHHPPFNTQRHARPPALFLRADTSLEGSSLRVCRAPQADGARYLGPFRTATGAAGALRLARELAPDLRGRARAGAASRQPLVVAILRFFDGDKDEILERLRAEQRSAAARVDHAALARTRALTRRVLDFRLDVAHLDPRYLAERLLVLSPSREGHHVHLIDGGYLLACLDAPDEASARAAVTRPATPPARPDAERADEPGLVLRWLCGLGPEHVLIPLEGR